MYHHLSGGFAMDPRTVHRIAAHRLLRTSAINSSNCCLSATLPVVQSDWISGEDPEWRMPYQRPASETTRLETSLFKPYRHYSPLSLFPSLSVCLSVCLSIYLSLSSPPALSLLCTTLHRPELLDKKKDLYAFPERLACVEPTDSDRKQKASQQTRKKIRIDRPRKQKTPR
jgi:hypothetical protein